MNSLRGIDGRNYSYSEEDHLLIAGDMKYDYDVDGFLTNKTNETNETDKTSYVYSSRGELLSVSLPDGRTIEYVHDPLGRRIAKKVNGTIVEKYLWQGLTRLLAVYDGSNSLLMRFEYADGRLPVAMTIGGSTYYLTYDQVGSLRVVADSAGHMVKRIDYDSFGNIIADTNEGFAIPFGFAGGLHDRDTGLVRFGFRDYDPDVGRWTAKDPIFFAGGDTDLYGYVLNDPVNWIDPSGLQGSQWNLINASRALHGAKPQPAKPLTPEQKQQLLKTFQNLVDNISNFFPGPKTIILPKEVLEKIMEELNPLKPKDAEACAVK
jgi:RHS repeat-associated protein